MPIPCEYCGAEFVPKNSRNRYCAERCQIKARQIRQRERYATDREYRQIIIARADERVRRLIREGDPVFREQRATWQRLAYQTNPSRRQSRLEANKSRKRGLDPADKDTLDYIEIVRGDPCSYCGGDGGSMDHIDPVNSGGDHHWSNMTGACQSCNSSKREREDLLVWMFERKQMATN